MDTADRERGGLGAAMADVAGDLLRIAAHARRLADVRGNIRLLRNALELIDPDRPVGRLLSAEGNLSAALQPGGTLDRLLANDGLLNRLAEQPELLDRLTQPGGTLDQIESLNSTAGTVRNLLEEVGPALRAVSASPLGDFTGLFQARRRPPRPPTDVVDEVEIPQRLDPPPQADGSAR